MGFELEGDEPVREDRKETFRRDARYARRGGGEPGRLWHWQGFPARVPRWAWWILVDCPGMAAALLRDTDHTEKCASTAAR